MKQSLMTMDAVHGWTFGRKMRSYRITPESITAQSHYRMALRRAQKYTLDGDALRTVCEASYDQSVLESCCTLARLPYDTMFIELDLHAKLIYGAESGRMLAPLDLSKCAERMGLLFQKDIPSDTTSARWTVTTFYHSPSMNEAFPSVLLYTFDPEGAAHSTVKGSSLWGTPPINSDSCFAFKDPDGQPVTPQQLAVGIFSKIHKKLISRWVDSSSVSMNPWWRPFPGIETTIDQQPTEELGALRWMVVLLGLLNSGIHTTRPRKSMMGTRLVHSHVLPYLQHHEISITLPVPNRISYVKKSINAALHNMPRAWHQVAGHWRCIGRGKRLDRRPGQCVCRHEPEMIESGLAICRKCALKLRWINNHSRGDPTVGIVDHTYAVHGVG